VAAVNYTSVDRITDQLPALIKDTDISSSTLCSYAEDAENEINGSLARRFTIPVSGSPPLLQTIATKIATGLLLSQHIFTQERLKKSEWPDAFLEAPREMLEKLASGEMTLVNSAGTLVEARNDVGTVWSNTSAYEPTITELPETRQIVDPDKIEDLESDRNLDPFPDRILR